MPDSKDKIQSTHHPGIPQRIDLSGCTFQGKQLSAHQLAERERRSEAMKEHRKEIDNKVIILRRKHTKAKGNEPETRKVSVRGRHFSSNEIRREYGIMAKPYKSKVENVLWCILNKGPIDMRGMADVLEYDDYALATKKLSGPISNLFRCLGTKSKWGCGWITRKMDGKRYHYQAVDTEKSVEVMYAKYCEINRKIWQKKRDAKKEADQEGPESDSDVIIEKAFQARDENNKKETQETKSIINRGIEQYLERLIGLTVEVNGHIDINVNFGFKERE